MSSEIDTVDPGTGVGSWFFECETERNDKINVNRTEKNIKGNKKLDTYY